METKEAKAYGPESEGFPAHLALSQLALKMTGAEMVWTALAENNVKYVFGYPGGAILPTYDAYKRQKDVRHILVRHEQGAVHAADGYARSTGNVGVVLVTSGPGATNTLTGIHTAFQDSVPLIVITGQVPLNLLGTQAFQECDITSITRPCTKKNYLVRGIKDLPQILHEAFYVARSGRPGPVLIDIPKDIQTASGIYRRPSEWDIVQNALCDKADDYPATHKENIQKAVALIAAAKRPILYTGGGVVNERSKSKGLPEASKLLRTFAEITGFPVTSTLMGLGAFPASDPQWLGMPGMHGTIEANMALCNADLIIAIGARFDDRITSTCNGFASHAKIIHIDIDPAAINKLIPADVGLVGDCSRTMNDLLVELKDRKDALDRSVQQEWWREIDAWRRADSLSFEAAQDTLKPQAIIQQLDSLTRLNDAFIVTDVGQHQMWVAQYYGFERPNRLITSGGFGTMGFGLPAAIGTQLAHPDSTVVCVSGDGSIQMNAQEMITATQYKLPVKVLLLNNQGLGMVREWQELVYDRRYSESSMEIQPDFIALAGAYGWKGLRCSKPQELKATMKEFLGHPGPALLDCRIDTEENVYPIILPGNPRHKVVLAPHLRAPQPV